MRTWFNTHMANGLTPNILDGPHNAFLDATAWGLANVQSRFGDLYGRRQCET